MQTVVADAPTVDWERRTSRTAAAVLLLAVAEKVFDLVQGGDYFLALFVAIDLALAIGLFMSRKRARRLGVARAVVMWAFWAWLTWIQNGPGIAAIVALTEGLISAPLIVLLLGRPSRPRQWIGLSLVGLKVAFYALMVVTVLLSGA